MDDEEVYMPTLLLLLLRELGEETLHASPPTFTLGSCKLKIRRDIYYIAGTANSGF